MMSEVDLRIFIYGLLLAAAGLALRLLIGSRRFNRRNSAGSEYYSSYSRAVIIRLAEAILDFVGLLLIIGGTILIIIVYFN